MLLIVPMSCAVGVADCDDTVALPDLTSAWAGPISIAVVVVVILIVVAVGVRRRRSR